jgi:glycosyltransferase involved in cell wall biosynthesis
MAGFLVDAGHHASVIYIASPTEPDREAEVRSGVHILYMKATNLHYYAGSVLRRLPTREKSGTPSGALIKAVEQSVALRRGLERIRRTRGPIDMLEVPEAVTFPALFERLAPYTVKLHSSEAAWRHFCGEEMRPVDQWSNRLERRLLQRARFVSAPSAAVAGYVADACRYDRTRIVILPYPLDIRRFRPGRESDPRTSVLFVGRLDERKGLYTLARAAAEILTHVPTATIDIVGGETQAVSATSLRRLVPPHLHDRFRFHGRVPHAALPEYYRAAALCVVPSRWDNSPNAVYEALGSGTPVVASNVGGIPELVTHGREGLLVPRDEPRALATAVTSLLKDDTLRRQMSARARERAITLFNPDEITSQTVDLYRAAVATLSARPAPSLPR